VMLLRNRTKTVLRNRALISKLFTLANGHGLDDHRLIDAACTLP
jgi:hypothetical protein